MLLSVATAVVTAPVLWFVGSVAGVAMTSALQEVRVERQVRRIRREQAHVAGAPWRSRSRGPA